MTVWLISANSNTYNHVAAFNKWGYIDWKQSANYQINDIIYIYATTPDKHIRFKTQVIKNNMEYSESEDDSEFWIGEKPVNTKYSRLKLIQRIDTPLLSLERLYENGLKQAPQGALKLKGDLLDYIEKSLAVLPQNGINVAKAPLRIFKENNKAYYRCPNCKVSFVKAPRCPNCGQLVKE